MDAEDRRIARFYAQRLARFGPDHRALHWSSPTAQTDRFARLAAIGLGSGDSLLDVGCGLGDFLGWLAARGVMPVYTGLDMTPQMVAAAGQRHPPDRFPGARFLVGNLMDPALPLAPRSFDWVVASGIFACRTADPQAYMRAGIARMMALAGRGVAFNAQSTRAPNRGAWRLFHADPEATLAWCQSRGWSCLMVHDAWETDFTVCLWRPV